MNLKNAKCNGGRHLTFFCLDGVSVWLLISSKLKLAHYNINQKTFSYSLTKLNKHL